MSVKDITAELKRRGHKFNANYASQTASSLPEVSRIGAGMYRLDKQSSVAVAPAPVKTQTEEVVKELPREVLLLQIETLQNQNRALHAAHSSLMRGILV